MRLIDADKLRINCFCVDRICVDGRTIENAPTIKAIPIEWIKKEIGCSIEVVRDGDYDYSYSSCILQLLERWEKENERETNRHQ